jgi:hypothetical protein
MLGYWITGSLLSWNDQFKEDDMGRSSSKHVRGRKAYRDFGRDHLETYA